MNVKLSCSLFMVMITPLALGNARARHFELSDARQVVREASGTEAELLRALKLLAESGSRADVVLLGAAERRAAEHGSVRLQEAACVTRLRLERPLDRGSREDLAFLSTVVSGGHCGASAPLPWAMFELAELGLDEALEIALDGVPRFLGEGRGADVLAEQLRWRSAYCREGLAGYRAAMMAEDPKQQAWGARRLIAVQDAESTAMLREFTDLVVQELEAARCVRQWPLPCSTFQDRWGVPFTLVSLELRTRRAFPESEAASVAAKMLHVRHLPNER